MRCGIPHVSQLIAAGLDVVYRQPPRRASNPTVTLGLYGTSSATPMSAPAAAVETALASALSD